MSAIIHVMGRVTKDPAMQQGKNNGSEYISLDLASSQRSQNTQNGQNGYESMFYQCYFNKFLAERLIKAGVKSGTCIYVYGDLDIHPFLYQQGQKAGQPGVGAKINVKDWQFCLSNKPENENNGNSGNHQNGNSMPNNSNGGAATSGSGSYQSHATQGNGYMNGVGNQNAGIPNTASARTQGNSYAAPPSGPIGNNMYQQSYYPQQNMAYGQQGSFTGDGFQGIPEGMADQLPFNG